MTSLECQYNCQFYQMIITSAGKEPFCKRVQYSHQTDIYLHNKEAQGFVDHLKSTFRVRKCMSAPKIVKPENNYNHYYVNPELRFKKKNIVPNKEKDDLQSQEHVYFKLHDQRSNIQNHPFEKATQEKEHLRFTLNEDEIKKLLKFKGYVQTKGKGRVPQLVNEYLKQKK